jgi:uncharacterized protein (TIGR02246 family)
MTNYPMLSTPTRLSEASSAVEELVGELQRGIDERDADIYNPSFAGDVIWGGPYGATVRGYDDLHEIHQRLHADGVAGQSRYEIVQVTAPQRDLAIADVRRRPLEDGDDDFAEMALYVLVRAQQRWWLVAGQNTVVQPGRSATD